MKSHRRLSSWLRGTLRLRSVVNHWNASDTRRACSGSSRQSGRIRRRWIWSRINPPGNTRRLGKSARVEWVVPTLRGLLGGRVRAFRRVAVVIGRNRSHVGRSDALWLAKQGNQNDRREDRALRSDGDNQGPPTDAPFTRALFCAAFHETSLQGTKIFLGIFNGFDGHHTPPQECSARECGNFCGASFLWVA